LDNSTDHAKFFDIGEVKVLSVDSGNRQAGLYFVAPICFVQPALPALLSSGSIDSFAMVKPFISFTPKIKSENTKSRSDQIVKRINTKVQDSIAKAMSIYSESEQFLSDPSMMLPVLPLGIYVSFTYRCGVDQFIIAIKEKWNVASGSYEDEFKWATTRVMAHVLSQL
jgi:hypothetical protein